MIQERADDSAVEAEVEPSNANPLLPLISLDLGDQQNLIAELRDLPPGPATAKWVDELLDDPRLGAMPYVREAAVQTLLEFGHPHALLINPEHLAEYRKHNPSDVRPRRLAAGGAAGALLAVGAMWLLTRWTHLFPLVPLGLAVMAGLWSVWVAWRAVVTRSLRRTRAMAEVVVGLGMAAGLISLSPELGAMLLPGVVPVALAGLSGGWAER